MKYICRKYNSSHEYMSEVILDSRYDSLDNRLISNTLDAMEYCKKYLTSDRDIRNNTYFICYRISK